jgi:cobalt-zinc-cadmium efflux system membrane fusion protein
MRCIVCFVLATGVLACRDDEPDLPAASTAAVADTAFLTAESVRIGGLTLDTVTREPWTTSVSGPARVALDPAATEPIGSIVEGRVIRVYVMPGDRVRRGQVLVAIHSHELMDARAELVKARAAVTAAEVQARVATSAAERAERLHAIKALSLADLERARASREDADAVVVGARAELGRGEAMIEHLVGKGSLPGDYDEHWVLIRAPIDGQVVSREAEPGNVVLISAPLLTVSRTSSLVLIAALPDDAAATVHVGAPVSFSTNATGTEQFVGRVTRVFPTIDTLTRTVEVHATIAAGDAPRLRPEMFAKAEFSGGTAARTLVVPVTSVQAFGRDTALIRATSRATGLELEVVRVRIGRLSRQKAEVLSGIDSGSVVVSGGAAVARAEILKRRGSGS